MSSAAGAAPSRPGPTTPRLADTRADIVGFANNGVYTSIANGVGGFTNPQFVVDAFDAAQGWQGPDYPRYLADVTGDHLADIVGFGSSGVATAVADGTGNFRNGGALAAFGYDQGWRGASHIRVLADITGDGRADIVAFGNIGVDTATANGVGGFNPVQPLVLNAFSALQGWNGDNNPRLLADITGDGRADIVGFGSDGVYTAVATGTGTFNLPTFAGAFFGANQGWQPGIHPRLLADVNGDGRADIVGFGAAGVSTAIADRNGGFRTPQLVVVGFGAGQGWSADMPRELADITGDGRADIVGFGAEGVYTAVATSDGRFQQPRFISANYGANQGWQVANHPRMLADVTGDRRADIVGFGASAVSTAIADGSGGFAAPQLAVNSYTVAQGWQVSANPRMLATIN